MNWCIRFDDQHTQPIKMSGYLAISQINSKLSGFGLSLCEPERLHRYFH